MVRVLHGEVKLEAADGVEEVKVVDDVTEVDGGSGCGENAGGGMSNISF